MKYEFANGAYGQTNLANEPANYLEKREELRVAEVELMKQREKVAALRRALPQGAPVKEYEFLEVPADLNAPNQPARKVKLSELFTAPSRPLVIYHFMYGKKQTKACPMCTLWIDGYNGVAQHLAQNMDFAILAAADPETFRDYARERGWDNLRLLSAGDNTFKFDFGGENADGGQDSAISVFTKDANGTVRHFYTAHPKMAPDINERGIDLLTPVYNLLDLTPQGRGDWYGSLKYETKAARV
ncbi:MAG TPA: DUF899 family protein [Candidatus Acidoferrales bacterium]